MRRFLPLLLLSLIILPFQAHAFETEIDGVTYAYTQQINRLSVISYTGTEETLVIPETIEYEGNTYTVNTLGSTFLYQNKVVKHLTLPSTIKEFIKSGLYCQTFQSSALEEIDLSQLQISSLTNYDALFQGCSNLKSVKMPEKCPDVPGSLCSGCKALESVTFSSKTTYIGGSAFDGCTSLSQTNLLDLANLESIGIYAFRNTNLSSDLVFEAYDLTTIKTGAFYGCKSLPSIDIVSTGVTSIGESAFQGCTNLSSVDLSYSLTTIGASAFASCSQLKNIEFRYVLKTIGASAFAGTGITAITFPGSVTTLGASVCKNCTALTYANLESNITTIDASTFEGCTALTTVYLPEALTTINSKAFTGTPITTLSVPETLTTLGTYVFQNCTALKSLDLSATKVTSIPAYAFNGCTAMTQVKLPATVTSIGNYAFQKAGITSIALPTSVSTLGTYAFSGCTSLASADLSQSKVKTINDRDFSGCTNLKTLKLPTGLTAINQYAFYNSGITDITLTYGFTTFGINAFQNCTSLKTVTLTSTQVTVIPDNLFLGCTGLTTIKLPETVTTLGEACFKNCNGIKTLIAGKNKSATNTLNIPPSVTTIGAGALNCSGYVTVDLSTLGFDPKISYFSFVNCKNLKTFIFPKNANLADWSKPATTGYFSTDVTGLTVTLPSGETSPTIPDYFFYQNRMTNVIFQDVPPTEIGQYAFAGCNLRGTTQKDGKTSFRIPEGVKTIGDNAFRLPTGLASAGYRMESDTIYLAGSLTSIGNNAFYGFKCSVLVLERPGASAAQGKSKAPAQVDALSDAAPSLTIGNTAFSSTAGGPDRVISNHPVPPTMPDNGFSTSQYTYGELEVGYSYAPAYRVATGWENFLDNLVTSVEDIEIEVDDNMETERNDDRTYNLQGILMPADRPLAPGIYIRNGKKIYIQ